MNRSRRLRPQVGFLLWAATACTPGGAGETEAVAPNVEGVEGAEQAESALIRREESLMGTRFEIQVYTDDSTRAAFAIDEAFAEVARVEDEISEWREWSDISALNAVQDGSAYSARGDLLAVVAAGLGVSEETDGAFDMTFASCGALWSVGAQRIPTEEQVESCLELVDWRGVSVDLDAGTISIRAGSRIGVGGIGKGYGVDRAAAVLESHGLTNYVVDGGGDLRVRGENDGRHWSVAIAHPRRDGALLGRLAVSEGAVVSSGDYERFFEHEGVRYHHIIDPRVGVPARASVAATVIAPDAIVADALSTGFFVLGAERAIALAASMPNVEALVVDPDLNLHMTAGFEARFALAE